MIYHTYHLYVHNFDHYERIRWNVTIILKSLSKIYWQLIILVQIKHALHFVWTTICMRDRFDKHW
jgi:hypothetical protein